MNIPENSNTKRISIDLPEELISKFDQLRKEWGFRSRGPVIEKLITELLKEDEFLPKNKQQEIDFSDNNNNINENYNIDENTALVLIKTDIKEEIKDSDKKSIVSNNDECKEKSKLDIKFFLFEIIFFRSFFTFIFSLLFNFPIFLK